MAAFSNQSEFIGKIVIEYVIFTMLPVNKNFISKNMKKYFWKNFTISKNIEFLLLYFMSTCVVINLEGGENLLPVKKAISLRLTIDIFYQQFHVSHIKCGSQKKIKEVNLISITTNSN